jgi:hypothetical protein
MGCSRRGLFLCSCEAGEQSGAIRCGVGGAKGGDRGECAPTKHAPDSAPGKRDTGSWHVYPAYGLAVEQVTCCSVLAISCRPPGDLTPRCCVRASAAENASSSADSLGPCGSPAGSSSSTGPPGLRLWAGLSYTRPQYWRGSVDSAGFHPAAVLPPHRTTADGDRARAD